MDPITWMMLAMMAASTGANYMAQRKVNKATSQVNAEARTRREKQQKQSEALTMDTANLYTGTPDAEKVHAAELAKQYAPSETTPTTNAAGTRFLDTAAPTGSQATIDATTDEIAKADARVAQRGAADAKLRAFGDVMGGNAIQAGRNSQDIGQGASFVNSWQQNVMPALLQKANLAGRGWATAADVMKLAGAIMTPFALTTEGAGAGADAATKVASSGAGRAATSAAAGALKGGATAATSTAPIWQGATGLARTAMGGFGGMGLMQNPAASAAMRKQLLGLPLSAEELRALRVMF